MVLKKRGKGRRGKGGSRRKRKNKKRKNKERKNRKRKNKKRKNRKMIRNVLTRRREYGTYLATARRHRRRLKMQKRDE